MTDPGTQQLFELWKRQMEEGTRSWLKLMEQGQPMDPQAFWRPFMDQWIFAWSKVMTQGPVSADLMSQWKQFLDQWIAVWSKALEQAMGTDAFARTLGKQMEGFLNAASPARKAAEQYIEATLSGLGLPSRAQMVGIARQIVELEEKIEAMEDRLDTVLQQLGELAAAIRSRRPTQPSP